jgi:peptidoglycan/LPS O-acetylase OafA/YrhL
MIAAPVDRLGNRIGPIDGLRAVAVLGVVWAHAWVFAGTPSLSLGRIGTLDMDFNRAIAVLGNGVDLFFVISGFCMYVMYARRASSLSWRSYSRFLGNRWLRIAPAFYVAAFTAATGFVLAGLPFPVWDTAVHLVFVHTVVPRTGALSAPFWSLATEWQFYLVLPLLIWCSGRRGFWRTMLAAGCACIAFRLWLYGSSAETLASLRTQLPTRLIEFIWGMCAGRLHIERREPPHVLRGSLGFFLGVAAVYAGRTMMVTEVLRFAGPGAYLLQVLSEPVMTAGYGLLVWNVLSSQSPFRRLLSNEYLQAIGRWSYSLYLWHWWPTVWIAGFVSSQLGSNAGAQYLGLALTLAVLLPVAGFSYLLLERPYFRARARHEVSAPQPWTS